MPVQTRQYLFLILWTAFCFGLTLSPALISISQAGLALLGLLSFKWSSFSNKEKTSLILFIGFYLVSAISFIYSIDTAEASRKLILKLPILLFPLIYQSFKDNLKLYPYLLLIFSYAIFLPAAVSVYNYFSNKQLFDMLILQSKPLPVEFGYGIYHIQFSILLALSILLGADFLIRKFKSDLDWKWYTLLTITACNFLFIHILSARTGLLSLYIGAGIYFFNVLRKMGGRKLVLGALIGIGLIASLFIFSTSLKNRLSNTVKDFQVAWNNDDPNDYSFALRVQAWKNAFDIIGREPWGVGIGDAEKAIFDNYEFTNKKIEKENRKNPHFQMLESAVQSGWLSIAFYVALLFQLAIAHRKNLLLLGTVLLLYTASCFESILERQASVAAFALFIAFALAMGSVAKLTKSN